MKLTLTEEQKIKVKNALGDGKDWPKLTDDPLVNYAVDCSVAVDFGSEKPEYVEDIYRNEAEQFASRNK